jgi:hypothetical protein
MTDFSQLAISTPSQLFDALKDEVAGTASKWFDENRSSVSGYFESLAEASIETARALAEGRIGEEQAAMIFADQKAAFEQTIEFTKFMTAVLAQKLFDGVFSIVGWTVFRHTGINLFPELVQP